MKRLVDILSVELKRWPDSLGDAVGQASDGTLHNEMEPLDAEIVRTREKYTMCKNYIMDCVTRAEWQAAVDALNAPKVVEWDEFGFPPAGVTCEFTTNDGHNWKGCKILYADEVSILTGEIEGKADRRLLRKCDADVKFRPARTAEQVAAEEREAEDNEVMSRYMSLSDCEKGMLGRSPERVIIGLMRVMGYRKEPKPCGS